MRKFYIIFSIVIFLIFYKSVFSQERSIDIKEVLSYGQSLNSVSAIAQDANGFVWFGTIDGLVRYDGINFKTYKHNKTKNSISSNIARAIEIDGDIIWIGTQGGGLNKFNTKTGRFKVYTASVSDNQSLISNDIWSLHNDLNGNLWIGTWGGGIDKFNIKTEKFTHYKQESSTENGKAENEIRKIFQNDNGIIYAGTQGGGMFILKPETRTFKKYKNNKLDTNTISDNKVYSIFKSKKNEIWVGTLGGDLQKFNEKTDKFSRFNNSSKIERGIFDIIELQNNEIAVATNNGLFFISEHDNSVLAINNENFPSFKNNNIRDIFFDKDSILWIGTEAGAYKLSLNNAFHHLKHDQNDNKSLSGNYIRSVYEDSASDLWVGTLGNGLNKFNLKTKENIRIPFDDTDNKLLPSELTCIMEDSYSNFWITTWNSGLILFDKQKMKVLKNYSHNTSNNCISDNKAQAVIEEKPGILWVATENGLNRFDYKKDIWQNFLYNYDDTNSVSGNKFQTKALIKDQNGLIWAGTWANGLNLIIPNSSSSENFKIHYWKNDYQDTNSIVSNSIISLLNDSEGNLWIGTFGSGVAMVSAEEINNIKNDKNIKFIHYSTREGLINNVVYGIEEDSNGNIWFSTEKGLSYFSKREQKFRNCVYSSGLINEKYYWGGSASGMNNLYFGGRVGLDIVTPSKMKKNKNESHIEITDILFFNNEMKKKFEKLTENKNISELKTLKINKEFSFFTIKFIALNFQINSKIEYSYKLEGLDPDWIYNHINNQVTFSNLPVGSFHLKLKAKTNDNEWSKERLLLTIEIIPHWWETLWFKAFLFLSIITLIATFFYYRYKVLKIQKLEIEKKFEDRTEELRKKNIELEQSNLKMAFQKDNAELQIVKTEKVNKELNDFAYIISHDLKAPLRGISQLASWISMDYEDKFDEDGRIQLNLLIDRVKTMDKMIDGVLQYSRAATNFVGDFEEIDIQKIIDEVIDLIDIPKGIEIEVKNKMPIIVGEQVRIMQVFQNLINNAVKYMDKTNGLIQISSSESDSHWQFNIIDNGPGIDPKYHSTIFNIFKTVNETKTKDSTGIGLSIVKKIIQIYKGNIWVESELEKGAIFSFTISKNIG